MAASLRGSLERRRLLIDRKLAKIEAARLRTLDFQDAFMSDLHERDLAAIDHSLIRFRKAVDETFDRYSVLQLALQFETLSTQIYDAVFGGRFLHGLEYQVAWIPPFSPSGADLAGSLIEPWLRGPRSEAAGPPAIRWPTWSAA